ncbi:MAG TPA: hypothetical protein PKA27_13245 [Fimbriimonadaceae bacterium]|nr:hypothetical protein [Fimbriimonadaceae bacterium]
MKKVEIPPVAIGAILVVVAGVIGLVFWNGMFRQPPPADPRQFTEQQITDPDPPRLRDQEGGRN